MFLDKILLIFAVGRRVRKASHIPKKGHCSQSYYVVFERSVFHRFEIPHEQVHMSFRLPTLTIYHEWTLTALFSINELHQFISS